MLERTLMLDPAITREIDSREFQLENDIHIITQLRYHGIHESTNRDHLSVMITIRHENAVPPWEEYRYVVAGETDPPSKVLDAFHHPALYL